MAISYSFRNKTFLFVKVESWNFQHIFDLGFREPLQNSMGSKSCPNELKICEVSEIQYQRDAENFRFLSL